MRMMMNRELYMSSCTRMFNCIEDDNDDNNDDDDEYEGVYVQLHGLFHAASPSHCLPSHNIHFVNTITMRMFFLKITFDILIPYHHYDICINCIYCI